MVAEFDQLVTTYPVWAMASALLAGIASSASPCAIAAVPLVVGYVGGYAGGSRWRALGYAAAFVLGMALTFTAAAVAMVTAGAVFCPAGRVWRVGMAALGGVFCGRLLGALCLPGGGKLFSALPPPPRRGGPGAPPPAGLSAGGFAPRWAPGGVGAPSVIGSQSDPQFGVALMFAYAVGHGALLLAAGSSIGFAQWLAHSRLAANAGQIFVRLAGGLLLLYGGWLLWEVWR